LQSLMGAYERLGAIPTGGAKLLSNNERVRLHASPTGDALRQCALSAQRSLAIVNE